MDRLAEQNLDEIRKKVLGGVKKYRNLLRMDALRHTSQRMDYYKEIQMAKRSKIELINNLRGKIEQVVELEKKLFGCEMFKVKRMDFGDAKDIKASVEPHRKILRKQSSAYCNYQEILELELSPVEKSGKRNSGRNHA